MSQRVRDRGRCLSWGIKLLARSHSTKAITFLIGIITDTETPSSLAREALMELANNPPPELIGYYVNGARNVDDFPLMMASLVALGNLAHEKSTGILTEIINIIQGEESQFWRDNSKKAEDIYNQALYSLASYAFDLAINHIKWGFISKNANIRIGALKAAGLKKDPRLAKSIDNLKRDNDERVLVALVDTYKRLGATGQLLSMLGMANPTVKLLVFGALSECKSKDPLMNQEINAAIEAYLLDENEILRLGAMRNLYGGNGRTVDRLLKSWQDLHPFYYSIAGECLERILANSQDARAYAWERISKNMVLIALSPLIFLRNDDYLYWCFRILKSKDPTCTEKLKRALTEKKNALPESCEIEILLKFLANAGGELAKIGARYLEGITTIEDLNREKPENDKVFSTVLLVASDVAWLELAEIIALLAESKNKYFRQITAQIAKKSGLNLSISIISRLCRDKEPLVRSAAACLLTEIDSTETRLLMGSLLADNDAQVRKAALKVIANSNFPVIPDIKAQFLSIFQKENDGEVLNEAIEAAMNRSIMDLNILVEKITERGAFRHKANALRFMIFKGNDEALNQLGKMALSLDKDERKAAVDALTLMPARKVGNILFYALGDESPQIAKKAFAFLEKLRGEESVDYLIREYIRVDALLSG